MVILVEGPDGAGKTTLAKFLADEFELEYCRAPMLSSHQGPLNDGIIGWWEDQFGREWSDHRVYDRCFFISELVYQLATPGRQLICEEERFRKGIFDLDLMDPMMIFCLPPWDTSREIIRAQAVKLEGVDELALSKIHWAYHGIFAMWYNTLHERVIRYNFMEDNTRWVSGVIHDLFEMEIHG